MKNFPRSYVCGRTACPPVIDGRLDESVWQAAPWTEAFVDIEGDRRPAPRFLTRAKMLWDDRYLYIGVEMEEPHVWATLLEHDSVIFQDNDFEVFIDPDGDNHSYFELEINALNTTWILRLVKPYRDGGPALNGWEIPGLKSAVFVDGTLNDPRDEDRGWSAELALPWSALAEYAGCPAPPAIGDQWRMNFSRVEWDVVVQDGGYRKVEGKPEDNWVWSPQGVIDMHRPGTWGYVQFAETSDDPFLPDPGWPARMRLMDLYEAQRKYHSSMGRWAEHPCELASGEDEPLDGISIRLTGEGYIATAAFPDAEGALRNLTITQDSRLVEQGAGNVREGESRGAHD